MSTGSTCASVGILSLVCEFFLASFLVTYHIVKAFVSWIFPKRRKKITSDIILITGGGKGLGRLLAIAFAEHHPKHIILWGRHEETLHATAKAVRQYDVHSTYMVCDVSDKEQIVKKAADVRRLVGDVTMLVNNAGVVFGNNVLDSQADDIETTVKVNTLAHFWIIKEFLPKMIGMNNGHIVAINSMLGCMGLAGAADYCASKFALTGLAETLYQELVSDGKTGVHVTSIHPYLINTDMFAGCQTRFPWLLPSLEKHDVVKATVDAVLTNTYQVFMPSSMYPFMLLKSLLPVEALHVTQRFLGADRAMETFHGRQKQNCKSV